MNSNIRVRFLDEEYWDFCVARHLIRHDAISTEKRFSAEIFKNEYQKTQELWRKDILLILETLKTKVPRANPSTSIDDDNEIEDRHEGPSM